MAPWLTQLGQVYGCWWPWPMEGGGGGPMHPSWSMHLGLELHGLAPSLLALGVLPLAKHFPWLSVLVVGMVLESTQQCWLGTKIGFCETSFATGKYESTVCYKPQATPPCHKQKTMLNTVHLGSIDFPASMASSFWMVCRPME